MIIFGKKKREAIEQLAFVYYASVKRGNKDGPVLFEIVEQLDALAVKIGGQKGYYELMEKVHRFNDEGCEEFIRKYGRMRYFQ